MRVKGFLLASLFLVASTCFAQLTSLQGYLYYESQRGENTLGNLFQSYTRNIFGVRLDYRAYVYSPSFLEIGGSFSYGYDRWSGNSPVGNQRFNSKTPYMFRLRFLKTQPLSVVLSASRQLDESEHTFYRYLRDLRTHSATAFLNLPYLPKVSVGISQERYKDTFDDYTETYRMNGFHANMQTNLLKRISATLRFESRQYDSDRYPDLVLFTGKFHSIRTPTSTSAWDGTLLYQKWRDIVSRTAYFSWTMGQTAFYSNLDYTSFPSSTYFRFNTRFEFPLSNSLYIFINPGFEKQDVPTGSFNQSRIETAVQYTFRIKKVQFLVQPHMNFSYVTSADTTLTGRGVGFTFNANARVFSGDARMTSGYSIQYQPVIPELTLKFAEFSLIWQKNWRAGMLSLYTRHYLRRAQSPDVTSRYDTHINGILFRIPRFHVQLLLEMNDIILEYATHLRRYVELTLMPFRLGPLQFELFHRFEYVDKQYYVINRSQVTWGWGEFRVAAVLSYFQTYRSIPQRKWWEFRVLIQRPFTLFARRY